MTLPFSLTIRALGDEPEILIMTPARDLMRDTIAPEGMDVSAYLTGPRAVNFAHDHGRLPVGKTVSLTKSRAGIVARFRWLDANPDVPAIRGVFEEGVLGASVEFVPVEVEPNRAGGVHYPKTIMSGWVLTSNPANRECVRLMKSLGLGRRDDEPLVAFEPAALAAAVVSVIGARVRTELRRQAACLPMGRALGRDEVFVPVARGAPAPVGRGDTALIELDAAEVGRLVAGMVGKMVGHALAQQISRLRGRVD